MNYCIGNMKDIKKWKKQRAERGFSDYDIFEINTWFLNIMPEMIAELREKNLGYPMFMRKKYMDEHFLEEDTISDVQKEDMDEVCYSEWTNILSKMEHTFLEANPETCSYKELEDKDEKAYYKRLEENKKSALEMFVKYFDDLLW